MCVCLAYFIDIDDQLTVTVDFEHNTITTKVDLVSTHWPCFQFPPSESWPLHTPCVALEACGQEHRQTGAFYEIL